MCHNLEDELIRRATTSLLNDREGVRVLSIVKRNIYIEAAAVAAFVHYLEDILINIILLFVVLV